VRYDEIVRNDLPIAEKFSQDSYKKFIRLSGISEVLEQNSILKNLKCVSESNGTLYFTNVGALFFRNNYEDVEFRHAGIVCALYKGIDKVNILDAKELTGDVMSMIDDAMIFLKKHLRMSYKIVTVQRENILELPEDALREAVINAVCHRDYFEKGARVMVEIFDNRVDIVSPGGVCKGITPENFGTISITRNPNIANMLHRCGYIEQMGTGIERMRNATREARVAQPIFELSDFFKVTFKRVETKSSIGRQSAATAGSDIVDNIADSIVDSIVDNYSINEVQAKILMHMRDNPRISASQLANIVGMAQRNVQAHIKSLKERGLIRREGSAFGGHWVVLG